MVAELFKTVAQVVSQMNSSPALFKLWALVLWIIHFPCCVVNCWFLHVNIYRPFRFFYNSVFLLRLLHFGLNYRFLHLMHSTLHISCKPNYRVPTYQHFVEAFKLTQHFKSSIFYQIQILSWSSDFIEEEVKYPISTNIKWKRRLFMSVSNISMCFHNRFANSNQWSQWSKEY